MKGLELPVNIIIVIVIAVVVLIAVIAFFMSGTGTQMSRAEASSIYYGQCNSYCDHIDNKANRDLVVEKVSNADPEFQGFLEACEVLGFEWRDNKNDPGVPLRCLDKCPCDVSLTVGEANDNRVCAATCLEKCQVGQTACLNDCMNACG
jgi:hypothetical protein